MTITITVPVSVTVTVFVTVIVTVAVTATVNVNVIVAAIVKGGAGVWLIFTGRTHCKRNCSRNRNPHSSSQSWDLRPV